MELRELVTVVPRFTRSVNLERDAASPTATDGYILTSTAQTVLERLAASLSMGTGQRAWTITGSYGSGKSAFALYLSHLVGPSDVAQGRAARSLLKSQAPHLQTALLDRRTKNAVLREGYYPILISGAPEPLIPSILRAASCQVRSALGTGRVPECVKQLEAMAARAERGKRVAGTSLVNGFSAIAEYLLANGRAQGLFLVIDELGKFLEYAAREPEQGDVFVLQELAEASAGKRGLCLVTILHQAFERYAAGLPVSAREEWAKIQGRFEDIAFQEPAEQLIDLLSHAIGHVPDPVTKRLEASARKIAEAAAGLGLAPRGLSKQQFVQSMVRCAPIHPLAVLGLVRLCRKFGQHQRSLFSFLVSQEPHGFSEFLQRRLEGDCVPWYRLDNLYDYVAEALGNGLSIGESATRWAEVQGALDSAVALPDSERSIIKTVGLLAAVGSYGEFKPTPDLLGFAGEDPKAVRQGLDDLVKRSIMVYRRHSQSFGLWQGSDIDLEARLVEARRRVGGDASLARKLSQLWTPAPLVAKRHSFVTGTLRYFVVRFADIETFSQTLEPAADADGLLLYCLPGSREEHDDLKRMATVGSARERIDVLVALPLDVQSLRDAVHELELLRWVEENTPELAGDGVARRELRARLGSAESRVETALQHLFSPVELGVGATWYHRGISQPVGSVRSLAHLVSDICNEVYKKTPRLRNELLNRRSLSSAAAKARRLLVEAMVQRGDVERLGIIGTPPEMSMFASVLEATGIHRQEPTGYCFGAPTKDDGLIAVWEAMDEFFAGCELQRQSVKGLFRLLADPPFGLKDGVIPVLFCAAALAHDTEVALYEGGAFVPELSIEVFERLLRSPDKFELRRYQVTGVRREVFRQFAELFGVPPDARGQDIVAVVRPLFRFFNKLPGFTRQTKTLSPTALRVREMLFAAREPDVLLFEDLPVACDVGSFVGAASEAGRVTEFFRALQGALAELQRAYDDLLSELRQMLCRAFGTAGPDARGVIRIRAQRLVEHALDTRLKAFLLHLGDEQLDDVGWIEAIGTLLVGKAPRTWLDADRARYEVTLADLVRSFRHIEALVYAVVQRGQDPQRGDVLRIGITDRHTKDREAVVVVQPEDRHRLAQAVIDIEDRLETAGLANEPELALAVLAKAAQRFLAELTDTKKDTLKKVTVRE
jgi:hypothetical protein